MITTVCKQTVISDVATLVTFPRRATGPLEKEIPIGHHHLQLPREKKSGVYTKKL